MACSPLRRWWGPTRTVVLCVLASALAACSTRARGGSDEVPDATTGGGAGGAAIDCSNEAPMYCSSAPPESPATQSVTFHIENGASADRYLVTRGIYCDAHTIQVSGDPQELPVVPRFECGCECSPQWAHPLEYRRLAPGGSFDLVWDARALDSCDHRIDCSDWTPGTCGLTHLYSPRPLPPGNYVATLGANDQPYFDCFEVDVDTYQCEELLEQEYPIGPVCAAMFTTAVEFTLPPSGDVIVPVLLD